MKAEREIIVDTNPVEPTQSGFEYPEPHSELAQKLWPLLKALDASETPKLSLEEIEEYLERPLGEIAVAFPEGVYPSSTVAVPTQS